MQVTKHAAPVCPARLGRGYGGAPGETPRVRHVGRMLTPAVFPGCATFWTLHMLHCLEALDTLSFWDLMGSSLHGYDWYIIGY